MNTGTVFRWDPAKEAQNIKKHKVDFGTALRTFADPFVVVEQDRIENGELRWQALGLVDGYLMLLVAYAYDDGDGDGESAGIVRIISARRADRKERRRYDQNRAAYG